MKTHLEEYRPTAALLESRMLAALWAGGALAGFLLWIAALAVLFFGVDG